ncbi:MAG: UvrD-helicase domain-containing protein [Propionibacteriaceae bacterium]|nr:UvrD-helicase domain-containing protein [Propionibacteriaceae bacterium]
MDSSQLLQQELAVEQAHVDLVYRYLDQATQSAQTVARQGRDLFKSDRFSYVREEDGTALFERDAFAFQAARRLAILDAEHEGLVFGRLDHVDREVRYIGRIGVRDEEYEPLVIDWRARAAEPFYRATATHPMGVVRRRVLRCRNDQVTGIEDDLLDSSAQRDDLVIVGEGALMASLKRARGHQMRDIVATIQAEQDQAIRADHRGVTVISGGPGTGKTVVALHRAAYLLYSNRRRFERGGILVVGPSALFMNYIERVLPSLGEDSVTLRAIGQVAADVLKITANRIDSARAAEIKGSLRMVPLLKRLVSLPLIDRGAEKLQVSVKGNVLSLDATSLERIRRDILTRTKANAGRRAAEESLQHALYRQLPEDAEISFETAQDLIASSANYRMFVQSWWPELVPEDVLARLSSAQTLSLIAEGLLSSEEQAVLAESYAARDWSVADVALLDELMSLLGPVIAEPVDDLSLVFLPDGTEVGELVTTADLLTDRREPSLDEDNQDTFAHILVDEAQDLSPMQWRMLRRRGPQASWTIVGDAAQSSWPNVAESRKAFTELVGSAPQREFRLSTNYRSPAEVFELAANVVLRAYPDADLPNAVRSTGIAPKLLRTAGGRLAEAVSSALRELSRQVEGTIGVIIPPSRWDRLAAELSQDEFAESLGDRLVLVTPLGVKGLEYDAVIVVSPDDVIADSPAGERVLYVCLTRPTQRLVTIDMDSGGGWIPKEG